MNEEKRITVRLPAELHKHLTATAKRDRRSVNSQIVHLLEATLTRQQEDPKSP
ncbi:ribbon-helix-helix domain-containing protein [Streptomyces xiamenensis]